MAELETVMPRQPHRNPPGTSAASLFAWEPEELDAMESSLATQQYIQQLIRANPSDVSSIVALPVTQEEDSWLYEHLRQFCTELGDLITELIPVCTVASCPTMKASDSYSFLCASHKQVQECPAISYMVHTLESACAFLNDDKTFPSRVNINESSAAKLPSIARRIYRIFAHAYFQHREVYDTFENKRWLCARFHFMCHTFPKLVPQDMLLVLKGDSDVST